MFGINPYINFKGNCRQAIEFYKSALGAEEIFSQTWDQSPMADSGPAGQIMHATLKVGDSILMMSDDPNPSAPSSAGNIHLSIGLHDPARAQQLFNNLSQGGTVVMPMQKTFWAAAFGMCKDPFGISWMINCDEPKQS
jgi:PhnB protein